MQLDLEREYLTSKRLPPSKDQVTYWCSSLGGKTSNDALKSYPKCFQRKLCRIAGQSETDNLCSLPRHALRLNLLALHAGLTTDEQLRVFEPAERGSRKLIVSTNIAEVSLTSNTALVHIFNLSRQVLR